jgi:tRNA A-37 threonylcarbamoyl transferase component Bud32
MGSDREDPILTNLQRVDHNIQSYETIKHIIQSSAEGFIVKAETSNNETKHFFLKYVEPKKYRHKVWADLRRTIHYTRTEVRFYNEILPILKVHVKDDWPICPTVYLAEYNVEGLMDENESTEAKEQVARSDSSTISCTNTNPHYDENDISILEGKYGVLVLDNMCVDNHCFQRAPLPLNMALASVAALAKFHATAFQNEDILSKVSERLCRYGGSFHLKNRNPKKMQHLVGAWEGFIRDIGPEAPSGFFEDVKMQNLGRRVFEAAEFISRELSPLPVEPFATIVHGDYKAMNIFFKGDDEEEPSPTPILIDFASTGVGLGASDLAMHIAHVALPEDLDNGMEEILFEKYFTSLQNALPDAAKNVYSEEEAKRHFRFGTVDYFRFILGRQWNGATLEVFAERNKDTNFAMVNRSIDAALHFAKRVDVYLSGIEIEMKQKHCRALDKGLSTGH